MDAKEIEAGNRLIAEFVGGVYDDQYNPDHPLYRFNNDVACGVDELKYHALWDWLMPVVEKIKSLGPIPGKVLEQLNQFEQIVEQLMTADKEKIWKSVVQFLTWYNQQNPNP